MRYRWFAVVCAVLFLLAGGRVVARGKDVVRPIFAVVVSRHGVRSISHVPGHYSWPDWSPVRPADLTAHGYRLATYMGQFYRVYFTSEGLPLSCVRRDAYVYSDIDQRTLYTGRALVEGICGSPNGLPVYHEADTSAKVHDPLFNATAWVAAHGHVDAAASKAAVSAAASRMTAPEFDGLQRLLDARCNTTCAPVTSSATAITTKDGLSELNGPVKTASTYAEDLFLEYAQCRSPLEFGGRDIDNADDDLASAMQLHVLAYDVNARNAYNPLVRGATLFAHIVGMLEERAELPHPDVENPHIGRDNLAFIVGHDTQLGALGGILNAHWSPGNGLVKDDMPPGSALIFELFKAHDGSYRVRARFAFQTLDQFRSYSYVPAGARTVPVSLKGCNGRNCSVSLEKLASQAHALARRGFVAKPWTPQSDASIDLPPLRNPRWTHCKA